VWASTMGQLCSAQDRDCFRGYDWSAHDEAVFRATYSIWQTALYASRLQGRQKLPVCLRYSWPHVLYEQVHLRTLHRRAALLAKMLCDWDMARS